MLDAVNRTSIYQPMQQARRGGGEGRRRPQLAAAFKGVKAAIYQNHGLIAASRHSIEAAEL